MPGGIRAVCAEKRDLMEHLIGYDLARGSLATLRLTNGDFSTAATDCLENDVTGNSHTDAETPDAGDGFWYLVRAVNNGAGATFDSGSPSQVGSRDAGIQASSSSCPCCARRSARKARHPTPSSSASRCS